ncbi:MAG: DinB family protein [Gemmatimonadota bacterium]|nr:DinB family protein [Gemmatimonadota bacterium]
MGDGGSPRGDRLALLRRLLDHMLWADERVADALRAAEAPPREAVEVYAHLIATEQVWLARIRGTDPGPVWPAITDSAAPALEELRGAANSEYISYFECLTVTHLDRVIRYTNSAGDRFETRVEDILLHVFLHGAYHRGQTSTLLRSANADPLPTDYIAFVRGAPAATREDSAARVKRETNRR